MTEPDFRDSSQIDKDHLDGEILGDIQAALVKITREWSNQHEPPTHNLHHYTNVAGMRGILESSSLWASDARYLNDATELLYAVRLIDDVAEKVVRSFDTGESFTARLPHRRGFARNLFINEEFTQFDARGPVPFVASLCEDDDLLSQWRGYAKNDLGYSLGFSSHSLTPRGALPRQTFLRKVIYDPDQQRRHVRTIVERWLETLARLNRDGVAVERSLPYPALWGLQEALLEPLLCYKHPSFCEEREWRLIRLVDLAEEVSYAADRPARERRATEQAENEARGQHYPYFSGFHKRDAVEELDIRFRPSPVGLVPYIALELKDSVGVHTGRLPLDSIRQGPTASPQLALDSLKYYLGMQGVSDFHMRISASEVPLRY